MLKKNIKDNLGKMKTRTEIINQLIQERGYASYVETGLGDGSNFNRINCESKIGVDPAWDSVKFTHLRSNGKLAPIESDEFFLEPAINNGQVKYDIIFIDGLHHSDQVERDITNAWNCLEKGGMILIHD